MNLSRRGLSKIFAGAPEEIIIAAAKIYGVKK
jgi:hypothetical protein